MRPVPAPERAHFPPRVERDGQPSGYGRAFVAGIFVGGLIGLGDVLLRAVWGLDTGWVLLGFWSGQ